MPLTAVAIKNAKPREKAFKISDGGGLHLLVQPNGSKLWRLAYRYQGKQKLVSFGPFPSVSLIDARDKREKARRMLRDGRAPRMSKIEEKIAARSARRNRCRIA